MNLFNEVKFIYNLDDEMKEYIKKIDEKLNDIIISDKRGIMFKYR